MILLPAIDIKGGKVVRLFQGKFSQVTEYADDPVAMAQKWERLGAQWLHVVDLDGARDGLMANRDSIARIASSVGIPIEVGGGIRTEETLAFLAGAGVQRMILGTKAVENREFLRKMLAVYGERICVSLDCSNGYVAQRGWVSTTSIKGSDLAGELQGMGLRWMVYTDIARDGTLSGPNFEQLQGMLDAVPDMGLIASGGLSCAKDVRQLWQLKSPAGRRLWGAITGRAIYEGKLDFAAAIKDLDPGAPGNTDVE